MGILLNFIKEINAVYDDLKTKYISFIDLTEKGEKIGGTFYGNVEILSTVGTHFEKTIGYTKHYPYNSIYYDFVFKVGGAHTKSFSKIQNDFMNDFNARITNIFKKFEIENNMLTIGEDEYRFRINNEVGYGSNFNTYCGIIISIYKKDNPKPFRLNKEWIEKNI